MLKEYLISFIQKRMESNFLDFLDKLLRKVGHHKFQSSEILLYFALEFVMNRCLRSRFIERKRFKDALLSVTVGRGSIGGGKGRWFFCQLYKIMVSSAHSCC